MLYYVRISSMTPARHFVAALLVAHAMFVAYATDGDAFGNDGVDRNDPNFITASLLVMSPGDALGSCAGHACIRLECPTFGLDNIGEYLKKAEEEGRGVMQYRMNLPPDAKQRLWKILDERAAEDANKPYDYVKCGCVRSVRVALQEALRPLQIQMPEMPDVYSKTRRELWDAAVSHSPWNRFFLHSFCRIEHDLSVPDIEKIIMPGDLVRFLKLAKVNGEPIIAGDGVELIAPNAQGKPPLVTPMVVACFIMVLAIVNMFMKRRWLDWAFLGFQSLCGLFYLYWVGLPGFPATSWHWLVVPFNILPLIFWKLRQKWALWFTGVLVGWESGMIRYPHLMTDPAHLVLVGAYILFYFKVSISSRASKGLR